MDKSNFIKLIQEIVSKADTLKQKYIIDYAPVNYACIFCQSDEEYILFKDLASQLGETIEETSSGPLFKISPLPTIAGDLQLLKIRTPDTTRPERGDADFTLPNYNDFKEKHITPPGFSLIQREHFEMIELVEKNHDVRVYFSNPPLDEQLGITRLS